MKHWDDDILLNNRLDERLVRAVITDIEWERILLHITVRIEQSKAAGTAEIPTFYLVSGNMRANGRFQVGKIENDVYRLTLNISNPGYSMCLPAGVYRIIGCVENDVVCEATVDLKLASQVANKTNFFLRGNGDVGYLVNFELSDNEVGLTLEILCQDMSRRRIAEWNEADILEEGRRTGKTALTNPKKMRSLKRTVIENIYKWELKKNRLRKGKPRIMFMSEQSEVLGNNLQCVMDRLKERGLDADFEIYTSARNMVEKGHYGKPNWIKLMRKLAKIDILFVDDHCPFMDWLVLDDKTTVVQLWHAGAGYKSSGYSRWKHKGSPAPFSCHRQYDFGITPSKNIAHFFSEVFGINTEQILPTGMPRMDSYIDPANKERVVAELYQQYPEFKDKKVILFAPTYRGRNRKEAYYPYELIDFDKLYEFCGQEYIIFFKMHPWVSDSVPIRPEHRDKFVDMNEFPSINDLFYITDLLITDYSSSVFEFSLMKKPMLFFAFDEIQYSYSRGFHREYRPACPGKICNTFEELLAALKTGDYEFEKIEPYIEYHFDRVDSNATDRVIDWFLLDKMPEDIKQTLATIEADNYRMKRLDFSNCLPPEEDE